MVAKKVLSKKKPYYISDYRTKELTYFCLQYPEWKQALTNINLNAKCPDISVDHAPVDPVSALAELREPYLKRIALVETSARETDEVIAPYILRSVAYGMTYDNIRMMYENIPCNRRDFYILRRKFLYILSQKLL